MLFLFLPRHMLLFFRLNDRNWIGMLFQVCMEPVFVKGPHCIGAMSRNPPSAPSKRILLPTLQVERGNTCYDFTNSKNDPNIIAQKTTFSFLLFQEVRRSAGKSRLWPKAESVVQSVKVWAGRRLKVWRSTWRTADRWALSSQTLQRIRAWAANTNISPHLFK